MGRKAGFSHNGGRNGGAQPDKAGPPPAPQPSRNPAGRPRKVVPIDPETGRTPATDGEGRRLRADGHPVPLVVAKILGALDDGHFERKATEVTLGLPAYKFYNWEMKSGEPTTDQALRIARHLDLSLEYLLDRDAPVQSPYPRSDRGPIALLARTIAANGLTVEQIEGYLMPLAAAVALGLQPGMVFKILMEAGKHRDAYLAGQWSPEITGPGHHRPAARLDTREADRAEAEREAEERRRNGKPRPKTG